MEKVSDFFKEIKDRLSNPLISSFIISWLVANWRITIGVIFYKINDLKLDGYYSYDDLIQKNINIENSILWPLGIALFYTFIFPLLKNVILAFGAWVKRWGSNWTLNISKKGVISVSTYIRLRSQYEALIKELVSITNSESETKNQNALLTNEKIRLSHDNAEL